MEYQQLDIFSFLQPQQTGYKPGDWVEKDILGKRLTFDEIGKEVGNLIVMDNSTVSREWYKVVLVEQIITDKENRRLLVYYDGAKQRGMVNEMWFDEAVKYPSRAWKIADQPRAEEKNYLEMASNMAAVQEV